MSPSDDNVYELHRLVYLVFTRCKVDLILMFIGRYISISISTLSLVVTILLFVCSGALPAGETSESQRLSGRRSRRTAGDGARQSHHQ